MLFGLSRFPMLFGLSRFPMLFGLSRNLTPLPIRVHFTDKHINTTFKVTSVVNVLTMNIKENYLHDVFS